MPYTTIARLLLKKTSVLWLVALVLGTSACTEEQTAAPVLLRTHQAFDLVEFLNQEAKALANQKAAVRKTVSAEGKPTESKTITTINWSEELGVFADADINKPALNGLFTKEITTNAAGQQVHRFIAKEDARTNVQEVVYTLDAQGKLVALDAIIVQENVLFNTRKKLHLEAQPSTMPSLQQYSMEESQKLMFMDTEHYGIRAEIVQ